jgi:hypothetical protein
MISRAVAAGCRSPGSPVTRSTAKYLHAWLEDQDVSYVLVIKRNDTLTASEGEQRADELTAAGLPRSWQRLSAGTGAHGPREFCCAQVPVQTRAPARPRALAAGPPRHRGRPGLDRRQPLAHRGMLPAGQERGRMDHHQVRVAVRIIDTLLYRKLVT